MRFSPSLAAIVCVAAAAPALAVESCELNGQHVNPSNGNTTAGNTGPMRCRDGEGGRVVHEQELQGRVFKGVATGVHRSSDEGGRLRGERLNDERGRVMRERELDGNGTVVRDDEVVEDGARKAYAK